MTNGLGATLSRRSFLVGVTALLLPRLAWTEVESDLGLHWRLDDTEDDAREAVSGASDPITSRTGHAVWVGEGRNRALRLDGYSVWIEHPASKLNLEPGAFSVCAWVALEAYPVNTAALVQVGDAAASGFCFCIDKWGYPRFGSRSGNAWRQNIGSQAVPRGRWMHLAASVSQNGDTVIFLDGAACESSLLKDEVREAGKPLLVGKSAESPTIGDLFPTGVLNGLIKDVRVYRARLSAASLLQAMSEARPEPGPDLQINGDWCSEDKQRPQYHAMPPRAWTNEPHGLVYFKGQYHLFYQKNANGPYWGNINWGHLTSPNLYSWTEMPVALSPEHGVDSEGCWSGSVIDYEGKLAIVYTGGDGHRSSICLALSDDGASFIKYQGNPVISSPPQEGTYPEFRDPFVWREDKTYYLIAGSALHGVGGTALLYRSQDLIHWEFRKPLLVGDRETSGIFWEMPIFVRVGDMHVLIVCEVPGRSSYWVGTWKDEVFTPISKEPHRLELFNHLLSPTPRMTSAGEVLTMGIIPDQRSPKECWRAGWAHLYSIPRTLSVDADGRLQQRPFEAIEKWCDQPTHLVNIAIPEGPAKPLDEASGKCLRIRALLKKESARSISLVLRRSPDDRERTLIRYEWEIGRLILDRSKSSLDPEVKRDVQEVTYFPLQEDSIEFDLFLDESVLEVFVDQRAAFATRVYPTLDDSEGFAIGCAGGNARVETISIARVRKIA